MSIKHNLLPPSTRLAIIDNHVINSDVPKILPNVSDNFQLAMLAGEPFVIIGIKNC
jgi:hypothetical protein